MKVLYLVTGIRAPAASGSEFIKNLILEVTERGVSATIISPIYVHTEKNMKSWAQEIEKNYDVKFILIDSPGFIKKAFILHILLTPILTTFAVIKTLNNEKFDIIHEFTSTPPIVLRSLIYKFFKTPSIYTLAVFNKTILGKLFWFKVFNFGSLYLIPSQQMAKNLTSLGVGKEKVVYLPPGIDLKNFKSKISKVEARKKLKLPQKVKLITYFGAINKEKGVFDIVESSRLIPAYVRKNTHIAIFSFYLKGYSRYEAVAKHLKNSTSDNISFHENYMDIPLLLAASDCIIYPSQTGHGATIPPISIVETLAAKRPIITTDIIGIRELINQRNGILVPPKNIPLLAKAITSVSLGMVKFQSEDQLSEFDLANVADKLIFIYNGFV